MLGGPRCPSGGQPPRSGAGITEIARRNHRAAQQLLREIATQLVREAEAAYIRGDLLAAGENINCARECAELGAEGESLRLKINSELEELRKQQQWQSQRLAKVRAWADQGRVKSAIGLLKPLSADGDVQRLEIDLRERLDQLERYLREGHDYLASGELTAARQRLRMAQKIHAADPRVPSVTTEAGDQHARRL